MRPAPEADPLEDRPRGRCPDCSGEGWRTVLPSYAEHMYPMPMATLTDPLDAQALAVLQEATAERRAAAANTIYPCRTCRPQQFYRWANGHFTPEHDSDRCPQCSAIRRGKEPPMDDGPPRPAARPDLD